MSLFISAIASGSNGNCYYVGNGHEAVLIDAGISCKEIEKRMNLLGLALSNVKAIIISHEHSDHIKGVTVLSGKYNLPVYITPPTLRNGRLWINKELIRNFSANEPIVIGDLVVNAFSKNHDAADPYSFTVSCNNVHVGIFTDIGIACKNLIYHFSQCHAAFLESNYDEEMLDTGNYPYHLKQRIRSNEGHLSNTQALEVFTKYRPPFMSHLLLSHLSKNNNCPRVVEELFQSHAGGTRIIVASRYEATNVYSITNSSAVVSPSALSFSIPRSSLYRKSKTQTGDSRQLLFAFDEV